MVLVWGQSVWCVAEQFLRHPDMLARLAAIQAYQGMLALAAVFVWPEHTTQSLAAADVQHLARVHDVLRVQCLLDRPHHLHSLAVFLQQGLLLADANTVLAC